MPPGDRWGHQCTRPETHALIRAGQCGSRLSAAETRAEVDLRARLEPLAGGGLPGFPAALPEARRVRELCIRERFSGPPDSANGGYVAGLLAKEVGGAAEVTLRAPAPLEQTLEIVHRSDGVQLRDGEKNVAEARPIEFELALPTPPPLAAAEEASKAYPLRDEHPFPGCFTCGTARLDGLRIFPGPVAAREIVAAPWTPDRSLPHEQGVVRPEIVGAALDCPSCFGAGWWAQPGQVALLGRMSAKLVRDVRVARQYVVVGWALGHEGRRTFGASALFDDDGALVGSARAVWVKV